MSSQQTDRHASIPLLRIGDLDSAGLGFWGIVSGAITMQQFRAMTASKGENMARSNVDQAIRTTLHKLANARVLDDSTVQRPFDADRRCRDCGTIHEDQLVLQRAGAKCFRGLWGDVPLNPAGLPSRSGGRRRR